jgi:hypothetical protein
MEYFLGSLATIVALALLNRSIIRHNVLKKVNFNIRYSQSYALSMLGPSVVIMNLPETKETQSRKHMETFQMKVVFANNKAYWIKNNAFVQADVIDGVVQEDTEEAVDIMALNKVELDKMAFIVEKLTEGKINDSGNPGNKKF